MNSTDVESKIGPADAPKFQHVVWIGLTVGGICTIVFHLFVKEANGYAGNDVRGLDLRHSVGELLCNFRIYQASLFNSSCRQIPRLFFLGCSYIHVNSFIC